MNKIIHYCWFGGKPLPRSVKKCIKTWKKFLPDYEIKEWNESNFDVNQVEFVKQAYENKKWAFVSDYVRIYALYEDGGIYLDTDMKIIKNITHIMNNDMVLGYEDSGYCGTAIIYVKEKHNPFIKEILDYYHSITNFNVDLVFNYANPIIISKLISKYNAKIDKDEIAHFENGVTVYPRDYFYPISSDYSQKIYTSNTCMVHLFNATWTDKKHKRMVRINKRLGFTWGRRVNALIDSFGGKIQKMVRGCKKIVKRIKHKISIHFKIDSRVKQFTNRIMELEEKDYIVLSNPDILKDMELAHNLFDKNIVELREQYTNKEAEKKAKVINEFNIKTIIASAYNDGWEKLFYYIKRINPDIKIKVLYRNTDDIVGDNRSFKVYEATINLYIKHLIDEIGVFSEQLYKTLENKSVKVSMLKQRIIPVKEKVEKTINIEENIYVGLFETAVKLPTTNIFNQISAAGMYNNIKLFIENLSYKSSTISKFYSINLEGSSKFLTFEERIKEMKTKDVNLFVKSFNDTSISPAESLECGVPCVIGDNAVFKGTKLEEYIKVKDTNDIEEIYNKIRFVVEHKNEILDIYNNWKEEYIKESNDCIEKFTRI